MLEESMSSVSIWASIFSWFTPTVFFVFLNLTIGTIYFTSSLANNNSNKPERQESDETNPKLVRSPSVLQRLKSINLYAYRSPDPVSATTAYEIRNPDLDSDEYSQNNHFHFSFQHQNQQQQQQNTPEQDQRQHQQQPFLDRSPSVLQRLKSFNLYNYLSSPEQTTTSQKNREIPEQATQPEEQEQEEKENQSGFEQEEEKQSGLEPSLDEVYSQLKDVHVSRTKSDTVPASGEVLPKLPRKMRKSASVKSAFSHFEEEDIVETRRPATVREGKAKATEEDEEVDAKADDFINKFKQQLKLQRIDSILRLFLVIIQGLRVVLDESLIVGQWPLPFLALASAFSCCPLPSAITCVPNTLNVITNFPFLIVGILGFVLSLGGGSFFNISLRGEVWGWVLYYGGIASVAFGSAYYHLKPDDNRVMWDTLPMMIAYSSLCSSFVLERLGERIGLSCLFSLLVLAVLSTCYARTFNDLRLCMTFQLIPCIAIPIMTFLFPPKYTHSRYWLWIT
ncbi:hypothetical protein CCACVL1_20907, partial [Corchorus capsularis]